MRARRVFSWVGPAVERLRSSPRRVWWTSFVLVTLLCGLWAIATPPFGAPDEPAHVKRAIALDHGELTGKTPSLPVLRLFGADKSNLQVRVPEVFAKIGTPCFAFQPDTPANCLVVDGPSRDAVALTTAGRHPPAYYAVVGVASLLPGSGARTVYLMRFISALITGAFIATALTALRRTAAPRLVAAGLLVAVTPMVLFVGGSVNPSVPEIAAAIALWVCGLALVSQARDRIDNRLVTAVGISGCALALSRQLAPVWLGLTALTVFAYANRGALRNLARSGWARLWAALIAACALAQIAWVVIVKPLDATLLGRKRVDVPASEIVRSSLGATFGRYREMIGVFGWLDTPSPALTYLLWTAALGFLLLLAVMWARRRDILLVIGLVVATIVVPIILESRAYRDVGGVFWQGRYTLPLAVGIPIFAAVASASTERGRQFVQPRILVAIGAMLTVANVLAFSQNLRRYTVGYNGALQYWKNPSWAPPLSPLLLTVAYAIAFTAFAAWALVFCQIRERAPEEPNLGVNTLQSSEPQLTR
jgi:hypothetical protein